MTRCNLLFYRFHARRPLRIRYNFTATDHQPLPDCCSSVSSLSLFYFLLRWHDRSPSPSSASAFVVVILASPSFSSGLGRTHLHSLVTISLFQPRSVPLPTVVLLSKDTIGGQEGLVRPADGWSGVDKHWDRNGRVTTWNIATGRNFEPLDVPTIAAWQLKGARSFRS